MPRDSDADDFGRKYSSAEFLRVVRESGPMTTGEVANEIECHRNTARDQLKRLAKRGRIKKEEIGQEFVWRSN
ncbi:helix-turn-helix domain-containing protein [Natronorubrum daqingense]|uniref:helix-turn-helix domain-containing protein n=1 Tax=Natronorubrum daqingense TaxID=588898 RepID=UPI00214F6835|nr:helix-turn-helix domain-containing protein [Natronorubrum daqingense]